FGVAESAEQQSNEQIEAAHHGSPKGGGEMGEYRASRYLLNIVLLRCKLDIYSFDKFMWQM
ncbi:MAG: hypothetical protein RRZ38_17595, partial [Hafnia sp.]